MKPTVPIREIDLLVHPGFLHPPTNFIRPAEAYYTPAYFDFLLGLYKRRIDQLAKNPEAAMVIILTSVKMGSIPKEFRPPFLAEPQKGMQELIRYARGKLERRLIVSVDRLAGHRKLRADFEQFLKTRGFSVNPKNVKVSAYGEISDACVAVELGAVCRSLNLPLHDRKQVRIIKELCGNLPEIVLKRKKRRRRFSVLSRDPRTRKTLRDKIRRIPGKP